MSALRDGITAFADFLVAMVFAAVPVAGVEVNLIVLWLFAGMVFFTIWLGFVNVRGFGKAFAALRGKYMTANSPGEMTPFQALSTALSGTVGLGNIAGVAIAISMGGPGAALWMVVIGFFAMSLKCAEVTMAVRYRKQRADGTVSGGPMWYLSMGLAERGLPRIGRVLAYVYAFAALFAVLQILQVNQSYSQVSTVLGLEQDQSWGFAYGTAIALLTATVLLGGARWVAAATSRITPFMCALYLLSTVAVLAANASLIDDAIAMIFASAFSPEAATGGIIGAFVAGMRRAVYSNEAGVGTATMAHAMVKTDAPASEGYVALIEPFIDTIVICSATALMIVVTGVWDDGYDDIAMTSAAFGTVGSWFPSLLAICVVLFAFSTILAGGFYGQKVCDFLFGDRRWAHLLYLFVFCVSLPLGAIADVGAVINIVDSFFFLLTVPNLIGLYLLRGFVRREMTLFSRYERPADDPSALGERQGM